MKNRNIATGETRWEWPTADEAPAAPAAPEASTAAGQGGKEAGGGDTNNGLPAGWKEVKHAATGQTVYVHEATGTKRWDRPTSADDVSSDIVARQQQHAAKCVVF